MALRHHLPIVAVVGSNGGWTAVEKGLDKPALERVNASRRAAEVNVRDDEAARSSTARVSFYRMLWRHAEAGIPGSGAERHVTLGCW